MKIGFFDSGLGGLVILKAVTKSLPQYDYLYYGDTQNLPYGEKTEEEVFELTKRGCEWLFANGARIVIIACNTASAETLRKLQNALIAERQDTEKKILGVIIPTVEAIEGSGCTNVLLIATRRTVESGKYDIELRNRKSTVTLNSVSTPSLVPLIESGDTKSALRDVKSILQERPVAQCVVLGCTHYGVLKDGIRDSIGRRGSGATVLSQDEIIPKKLQQYLDNHKEIESVLTREGTRVIHLTDPDPRYDHVIEELLSL